MSAARLQSALGEFVQNYRWLLLADLDVAAHTHRNDDWGLL
jgi:hypothetical protein